MISAFAGKEEEAQGDLEIGIDHFLPKPITASSLYDTIMLVQGVIGERETLIPCSGNQLTQNLLACALLLAEDNEVNQFVAEELLTAAGFELEIVHRMVEKPCRAF